MSQAMTTLTATAAINGDPTASMPRMMSETPHRIDNVEACRTTPDGCCAIETSLKKRTDRYLTEGVYLKEIQERYHGAPCFDLLVEGRNQNPINRRINAHRRNPEGGV